MKIKFEEKKHKKSNVNGWNWKINKSSLIN